MIRKILLGIIILSSINLKAQTSYIKVRLDTESIGENYIKQTEIFAKEYIFPTTIYDKYFNPFTNQLTVILRDTYFNYTYKNEGFILVYDLNEQKKLWSKKTLFHLNHFNQIGSMLIQTMTNTSWLLNVENGKKIWKVRNGLRHISPYANIGIGLKKNNSINPRNKLEGVDLYTGNVIWERKIRLDYSWNNEIYLNDSVLLLVAGGLHTVNINNGNGWDYNTQTGEHLLSSDVFENASNWPGTYYPIENINSNVIVDSLSIYFASKEKISKINKLTGDVNWQRTMPANLASTSSIFSRDSLLYIINYGYAIQGYKKVYCGSPFIAALNKETGKQNFFKSINLQEDDPIHWCMFENDTLLLVFKDKLSKYSILDGSKIYEKEMSASYGGLNFFVGERAFIKTGDSTYTSLPDLDTTKYYVYAESGLFIEYDRKFNETNTFDSDSIYVNYLNTKDYKFIARYNQTLILDTNNKVIAEIEASAKSFLIENKLYDVHVNTFLEIDLSGLLDKIIHEDEIEYVAEN